VILFHSRTVFSTPSSIVYISNLPALSSSCLAIASFLLHLILAARTPPPKVTNQDSRFLPYKQYFMFGLVFLTTIPNALSCVALLHRRDMDHNRLSNVVKSVCLLHGFLVEMLGKNLEVYRMKPDWIRMMRLSRATVIVAVVLQALLLGSGVICLFVIDFEILWLLPCLMLWTQFALSIVMAFFGATGKAPRPLILNVVFYGITAIASSCITVAGIVLHWQLTFVMQYLFLQALLIWASYRLMTVIHNILPTKDRGRGNFETAHGSNTASSRTMNIVGESTDEKQENDIPRNLDRESFNPDGENIEMAGIPRKPERIYQPGRTASIASLSSDYAGGMFAMDSSEAILEHDRKELSTTLPTRLWRAFFARPHRRAHAHARVSHENELAENPEANGSTKSLDCSTVEAKYKDDTFDTESLDQASTLPVLEKHDPPHNPPTTSPIESTPTSKDKSDYVARFDALKHEVEQASLAIVSRHVEESDRLLREERVAKQTPVPMPTPLATTNVGGKPRARVAKKKSIATLPVLPESSSDCEDGLEGDDVTEEDVTGGFAH
jgi:hypothetical protein